MLDVMATIIPSRACSPDAPELRTRATKILPAKQFLIMLLLFSPGCVRPQITEAKKSVPLGGVQHTQRLDKTISKKVTCDYLLYLPVGYGGKEQAWPLILFLHGAGERGNDLDKIKDIGPLAYAKKHRDFPFVILAPQCPLGTDWSPELLFELLEDVKSRYLIDADRVYLTGYSMGGWGTWNTAMRWPELFAAIAPVCGRVIPMMCGNLWRTPVWVFHGRQDDVVPFENSAEMVGYLRGMENKEVRFMAYDDLGHYCWNRVYNTDALYEWFLSNKLKQPGQQ